MRVIETAHPPTLKELYLFGNIYASKTNFIPYREYLSAVTEKVYVLHGEWCHEAQFDSANLLGSTPEVLVNIGIMQGANPCPQT